MRLAHLTLLLTTWCTVLSAGTLPPTLGAAHPHTPSLDRREPFCPFGIFFMGSAEQIYKGGNVFTRLVELAREIFTTTLGGSRGGEITDEEGLNWWLWCMEGAVSLGSLQVHRERERTHIKRATARNTQNTGKGEGG
jgi:hypothetical protein